MSANDIFITNSGLNMIKERKNMLLIKSVNDKEQKKKKLLLRVAYFVINVSEGTSPDHFFSFHEDICFPKLFEKDFCDIVEDEFSPSLN